MTASRVRSFGAAVLVASLVSVSGASAATFTIVGGTDIALPGSFNPNVSPGFGTGTTVTYFTNSDVGFGLKIAPQNVLLTFEYIGYEAGDTNGNAASFTYGGTPMFTNKTTASGSTVGALPFDVGPAPGLVPFLFKDISTGNLAINGGSMGTNLSIAFYIDSNNSSVAYALFDDGGGSPAPDSDWDDMIVKITAVNGETGITPIPASLPLFAGGLGLVGLLVRRRKQKASAAI